MEEPIKRDELSTVPGERIIDKPELPRQGVISHLEAEVETIEGEAMLKVGRSRGFTVYSDEGPTIGGTGKYPPPMPMVALGIGF